MLRLHRERMSFRLLAVQVDQRLFTVHLLHRKLGRVLGLRHLWVRIQQMLRLLEEQQVQHHVRLR